MKRSTLTLLIIVMFFVTVGFDDCGGPQPQPPPPGGFQIHTVREDINISPLPGEGLIVTVSDPNRGLKGHWVNDKPGAAGNNKGEISGSTDQFSDYNVNDGRAPARWSLGETNGNCGGQSIDYDVEKGKQHILNCRLVGVSGFKASPSTIDMLYTPTMVSVTGDSISTTYGMPVIRYMDFDMNVVGQTQATYVSADGTYLEGNSTDLSQVGGGTYMISIYNINSDGTLQPVGAAAVELYHYEPPPDPGPCWGYEGMGNGC
jgi:hypothetical protein